MKKNIIAHMTSVPVRTMERVRRFEPLRKLFCLLLAFVIWLIIVNVTRDNTDHPLPDLGVIEHTTDDGV